MLIFFQSKPSADMAPLYHIERREGIANNRVLTLVYADSLATWMSYIYMSKISRPADTELYVI